MGSVSALSIVHYENVGKSNQTSAVNFQQGVEAFPNYGILNLDYWSLTLFC